MVGLAVECFYDRIARAMTHQRAETELTACRHSTSQEASPGPPEWKPVLGVSQGKRTASSAKPTVLAIARAEMTYELNAVVAIHDARGGYCIVKKGARAHLPEGVASIIGGYEIAVRTGHHANSAWSGWPTAKE
jgi:hypothetical protein